MIITDLNAYELPFNFIVKFAECILRYNYYYYE